MDNNKHHLVSQPLKKKDALHVKNPADYRTTGINQKYINKKELQSKLYRNSVIQPFTYKSPHNKKNTKSTFNDILINEKKYLQEKSKQTSEQKKNLQEKNKYSSREKRYFINEDVFLPVYSKYLSQNINLPQQSKNSTKNENTNFLVKNIYTVNKNKSSREKYATPRKLTMSQEQPIFFLQNVPGSNNTISNLSEISTSSLICTAINYKGEPVKINNQLVTDKLILSCQTVNPKTIIINDDTSNENRYLIQEKNNIIDANSPSLQGPKNFQTKTLQPHSYLSYNKYYKNHILPGEPQYKNVGTHNPQDSLLLNEEYIDQSPIYRRQIKNYYGETYINAECQKYFSKFRCFLWMLLIDNILLTIIGLILLLTTLYYILFRDYISTVIGNTGFVTWMWVTLIISTIIIAVAIYGIFTAIARNRVMLTMAMCGWLNSLSISLAMYIVLATVVILLIMLYLLLFWVSFSSLYETEKDEMERSFTLYRCVGYVHVAWDNVHKEFKCCGKKSVSDWKYVPTSCCSSAVVKECIGHFITPNRAYQEGCTLKIEDYFRRLFLIIIALFAVAVIILVIGIIGALQLLSIYKIIILCNERYLNHQWRER